VANRLAGELRIGNAGVVVTDEPVDDGLLDPGELAEGHLRLLQLAVLHLLRDDLFD
jgi:hypothetical protein